MKAFKLTPEYDVEHYPSRAERAADFWIHAAALAAAGVGALVMIGFAVTAGEAGRVAAATLYAVALIAMLACSAAYNLGRPGPARPVLHRLDEAAIFLLIAASYTPFTTQRFEGAWTVGMTALVWTLALVGVIGKLTATGVSEKVWTGLYVAFGWVSLIALKPMLDWVPLPSLVLLVVGGLIYSTGTIIFLARRLPFRRAIWHGFVFGGASVHWAAIFVGVVAAH